MAVPMATGRVRFAGVEIAGEGITDRKRLERYFITFSCYGARLHGDETGSVDPSHNLFGSRALEPDLKRVERERLQMRDAPYALDDARRAAVLRAIRNHCVFRAWKLLAAHVRVTHVHVVVETEVSPERVMTEFKSYASRELNRIEPGDSDRKRWARHGSTRWLWNDRAVQRAVRYVCEEQGEPMALYLAPDW